MKESNLIAILVVSMLVAVSFVSLTPVGAQNTSTSQAAVGGQTSEQLTKAPLNPMWLAYEQNLTAGMAITTTTATGNSLGHIPSPVDLSYLMGKMAIGVAQTYATSYDLRTVGKVTSVKNQAPYGTCWAFATFGSLESYLLPTEERNFAEYNLAKQSGFDYAWDAGGNHIMSTAYLSRWGGPVNELDDPYPGGDVHLPNNNAYTIQKHTQEVLFLPERTSSTNNDNIKWGLTTYGGLDASIYWNDLYYSSSPATYYNPSTSSTNHDVTLVGWDDNYAATNFHGASAPPGNGAFIVKNSWGTSWGNGGYFYLSYYDVSLQAVTAYTAEPISNYAAEYQYDPLGWVSSIGYSSTTAWGANVFTADSSATPLTAVSFYTNDVNTQYELYIYTNPTSGPIGGTQYVGPKGTMPMAGYHTVKLASPVPLSAGQRFSVVVKFTTSGYKYPLAVEDALTGYSSGASASSGQSYISSTGSTWTDITTSYSTMNACIKAFTSASSISLPTVNNDGPASGIGTSVATVGAQITSTGGANPHLYIGWGTSNANTGSWQHTADLGIHGTGTYYTDLSALTPGTTYYYRAYATNSAGTGWASSSASFTTTNTPPVTGWNTLSGYIMCSPSVIVDNLGKTEVWVKGGDNALWVNIDGSWQGKGGVLTSDPFAVKDSNGKIHVLVRGGDNGVWDFIYDPIAATGHWKGLGGYITETPTSAQDPINLGIIRVAVKGGNSLWTCDLNINTETYAWTSLGGVLLSRPYIMFDGSYAEHIFVRGGDNQLWDSKGSWTGSTWSRTWNPLGGNLANGPIATIEPGYSAYSTVFAKGSDNALWMCDVYSGGNPETGTWYGLGGVITSDPFIVADSSNNRIHAFVRGGDSALWENIFTTYPWNPSGNEWQGLGGSILTYTPGATIGSNTQAFVIGTDNALWRNTHTTFSASSSEGCSIQKQDGP